MKHLHGNKYIKIYSIAVFALIIFAVCGILFGATKISFIDIFTQWGKDTPQKTILLYVRIPRVFASILCGAALSVSGAVIQGVLANRLASPSIIGVNAGAGLAVTVCTALGILGGWRMSLFAFIGAFFAVMLVSAGAKKWGASRGTVILMGVAMNSLLGAVSDCIITFFPEIGIMRNDFRIGDFSSATYSTLVPAGVIITVSLILLFTLSNDLDVLAMGDDSAKSLGMNTAITRTVLLLLAAALSGAAVSVAGLLSFVGLLVPHAVRRIAGNRSAHLLPLCAISGAAFVTLCDTASRIIFAPYELPVGIIMAFLGAPFFLFILFKGKGGHKNA